MSKSLANALLIALMATQSSAWIRMNGIFTDNMVLQTNSGPGMPPVRIFGVGFTNETISITGSSGFPGPWTITPVKTGAGHWLGEGPWGNWSVSFDAPPVAGPYNITVKSVQNVSDSTTFHNVVFGEVIFCNGQSNMKLTVDATDDKDDEYAAAVALGDHVRINFINGNLSLDGPQTTPNSGNWTIASGSNGTAIGDFSAICWDHGRLLAQYLQKKYQKTVYVGLIEVSVGGTTIHHWVPTDVGLTCNRTGMLPNKGECVQYPPGWIYNGRMNPMLLGGNGLSVREVIYYQGEADSGENDHYSRVAYECELGGLVESYRRDFGQPNMPIIIIQLPGIDGTVSFQHDNDTGTSDDLFGGWQGIQLAQQTIASTMTGVGLAQVTDLGCCGLHYSHKYPVAERAFNITRELVYNDTVIDNRVPQVASANINTQGVLQVDIHFNNTSGLMLKETYHCNSSYGRHGWEPRVTTVSGQDYDVNLTCCSSTPAGHEGLGIVKMGINATKHPHDYWGGWVPADLKIVSDTLVTATAFLPAGVNATQLEFVDLNFGGIGCTLANSNGQPLGLVPSISLTKSSSPPPPPVPACACDVCDDPNPLPPPDNRIRIAAVGDSITRGHPLKGDNLQFNYPCTLQRLLGEDKYVVFNFGAGGHTMIRGDEPVLQNKSYWNSTQYTKAMSVNPHIVLIMLGTNDAVGTIWKALGDEYPSDYMDMIQGFQNLESKPMVHTMTCPPLYNGNFAGINQTVVNKILPGVVEQITGKANLPNAIPVFDGMGGVNLTHHEWFWGNGSYGCHPNMQGYRALSGIVYDNLHL